MASGNDFTHEFPLNVEHENFDARDIKITSSNANAIFVFSDFCLKRFDCKKNSVSLHLKIEKREELEEEKER